MRALIKDNEIYPETLWNEFTRNHLKWMCDPQGDGWTLVENYVDPTQYEPETVVLGETRTATAEETDEETITIGGKEYKVSDVIARLA